MTPIPRVNIAAYYAHLRQTMTAPAAWADIHAITGVAIPTLKTYINPSSARKLAALEYDLTLTLLARYSSANPNATLNDYIEHVRENPLYKAR